MDMFAEMARHDARAIRLISAGPETRQVLGLLLGASTSAVGSLLYYKVNKIRLSWHQTWKTSLAMGSREPEKISRIWAFF